MSDVEWDNDEEYLQDNGSKENSFTEKKNELDEEEDDEDDNDDNEEDDEDFDVEEQLHHFEGDITPILNFMKTDPQKPVSEKHCNDPDAMPLMNCLSKYYVGKEIARGSQSVILEACESKSSEACNYVIRITTLFDGGKNKSADPVQHERGQQYLRDIRIRRYITCHCPQLTILPLIDAFMCRRSPTELYGISVAPKLSGNILDYLLSLPNPMNVIEDLNQALIRLIQRMHLSCFLVHRDISYQNILYTTNSDGTDVVLFITDFESGYIEPEATRPANKTSRIYDGYKNADNLSVQKTIHELQLLAELLSAEKQNDNAKMSQIWRQLSSFVKSDLIRRNNKWQALDQKSSVYFSKKI
jgi:serine/threonine protein kinase